MKAAEKVEQELENKVKVPEILEFFVEEMEFLTEILELLPEKKEPSLKYIFFRSFLEFACNF